jgi:hypothetical protein
MKPQKTVISKPSLETTIDENRNGVVAIVAIISQHFNLPPK